MNAWFSPEIAPWFSLLSLLSVVSLLERYARQGRHRGLVVSAHQAVSAFGWLLAATAVVAWVVGQPGHVVFTFGLCGGIIGPGGLWSLRKLHHLYEEAELRKTVAHDLE